MGQSQMSLLVSRQKHQGTGKYKKNFEFLFLYRALTKRYIEGVMLIKGVIGIGWESHTLGRRVLRGRDAPLPCALNDFRPNFLQRPGVVRPLQKVWDFFGNTFVSYVILSVSRCFLVPCFVRFALFLCCLVLLRFASSRLCVCRLGPPRQPRHGT